jgi:hypothetical protein
MTESANYLLLQKESILLSHDHFVPGSSGTCITKAETPQPTETKAAVLAIGLSAPRQGMAVRTKRAAVGRPRRSGCPIGSYCD